MIISGADLLDGFDTSSTLVLAGLGASFDFFSADGTLGFGLGTYFAGACLGCGLLAG